MILRFRGVVLLGVQLCLVLSVAGKYWYERETLPAVWVRTGQYDPETPLRGRYLALTLTVDACGLPRQEPYTSWMIPGPDGKALRHWEWRTSLQARDGKLVAVLNDRSANPSEAVAVEGWENRPCDRTALGQRTEYFIPEHAKLPLPLKPGAELWVLVTVPKTGMPRPIELAVSDGKGFRSLRLD